MGESTRPLGGRSDIAWVESWRHWVDGVFECRNSLSLTRTSFWRSEGTLGVRCHPAVGNREEQVAVEGSNSIAVQDDSCNRLLQLLLDSLAANAAQATGTESAQIPTDVCLAIRTAILSYRMKHRRHSNEPRSSRSGRFSKRTPKKLAASTPQLVDFDMRWLAGALSCPWRHSAGPIGRRLLTWCDSGSANPITRMDF